MAKYFSFSPHSQADEDSEDGEGRIMIMKKDREVWIIIEYCGTWVVLSNLFLPRLISLMRWSIHCHSITDKCIYWVPSMCWVYLPEYFTFIPASMQCLALENHFPTLEHIFFDVSNFYTIFKASFNFNSSTKYAQTMPVYNYLSHPGCIRDSAYWLVRPNIYIFSQLSFSDLKL